MKHLWMTQSSRLSDHPATASSASWLSGIPLKAEAGAGRPCRPQHTQPARAAVPGQRRQPQVGLRTGQKPALLAGAAMPALMKHQGRDLPASVHQRSGTHTPPAPASPLAPQRHVRHALQSLVPPQGLTPFALCPASDYRAAGSLRPSASRRSLGSPATCSCSHLNMRAPPPAHPMAV